MKHTLFTLLAVLAVSSAFGGNLNKDDWFQKYSSGQVSFTTDNTVIVSGHSAGSALYYTPTTHQMENESSLAITFQFDTATFATENTTLFTCYLFDSSVEPSTIFPDSSYYHYWCVATTNNHLEIFSEEDSTKIPISNLPETTVFTLNYGIENSQLFYSYTIGTTTSDRIFVKEIDTDLYWRPGFEWDSLNAEYKVTNVTFTAPVPEPTTATLSLLALFGLAARRRRK